MLLTQHSFVVAAEHFLATQRISPERPLRGSKSGIPKPPFRCERFQQSGRGLLGLMYQDVSEVTLTEA